MPIVMPLSPTCRYGSVRGVIRDRLPYMTAGADSAARRRLVRAA
ncbi:MULTISPECIES: hypothetical protein [Actinomyces]|nr:MULTISPECIES: hypothetical protein [Actinomyces]